MIAQFLWPRIGLPGAVICATWFLGCGGIPSKSTGNQNSLLPVNASAVMLALDPGSRTVATGEAVTFTSPFTGISPIGWSVNGVPGGDSVLGSVDSNGRYTAPLLPPTDTVTLTASLPDASEDPGALTATARITIVNPGPTINEISPNAIPVGSQQPGMVIVGTGFNPASKLTVNGQSIPTTFLDTQHLSAALPGSVAAVAGTLSAIVSNPTPGGGSSNLQNITVLNPVPLVTQISPQSANAGSRDLIVTLTGGGLLSSSHVSLNGQVLTSALQGPSNLSVVVPSSMLISGGTLLFTVSNDSPGGGSSIPAALTVLNPAPVVAQIFPQSSTAGSPDLKVTLTGSGFQAGSHVSLNGQALMSTLSDASTLSVVVPSPNLASGGKLLFTVTNDSPGGGSSISPEFTVFNPIPVATSLSPATVFAGTGPVTMTISGSGFFPGSLVSSNGQTLTTTFLSQTQLQVSLPNSLIANTGQVSLLVTNPSPAGGSSSPIAAALLANGQVAPTGNPQVASYFVTIPDSAEVNVGFGQQDYSFNTSMIKAPSGGGQVRVLVAGMKPNTEYHLRASMFLNDGSVVSDIDHVFESGALPENELPTLTVTRTGLGQESPGVQLFDDFDFSNRISLFATDREGNIIWTYARSATEGAAYQPAKLLDNGDIIVNTAIEIREFNLAGETTQFFGIDAVNTAVSAAGYQVPINILHHDLQKLPNGHFILLGNTYKTVILNGQTSPTTLLGDVIIDLDPNLNVVWFWNSFDHLDVNRRSPDPDGITAPNDWTHSNAVLYLSQDGNLLISMRHQSWILKIDYENGTGSGDVLWKLGWQGDFDLAGDPSAWFYFQHYPNVLSDDGTNMRIAVFDNGDNRILDAQQDICGTAGQPPCYSRALILDLDEEAKTASVEFQANLGLFSYWGGSAQVVPTGNFFAGITVTDTGGRALEISTQNPSQTIWQLDVLGQNAYRTLRIPSL